MEFAHDYMITPVSEIRTHAGARSDRILQKF